MNPMNPSRARSPLYSCFMCSLYESYESLVCQVLCAADRVLADQAGAARRLASSHEDDHAVAALYTAQRFSGGLVMLLMMSFNVIIFTWTVLMLGAAERYLLHQQRGHTPSPSESDATPLTALTAPALSPPHGAELCSCRDASAE